MTSFYSVYLARWIVLCKYTEDDIFVHHSPLPCGGGGALMAVDDEDEVDCCGPYRKFRKNLRVFTCRSENICFLLLGK
jgi:hypothetical protein